MEQSQNLASTSLEEEVTWHEQSPRCPLSGRVIMNYYVCIGWVEIIGRVEYSFDKGNIYAYEFYFRDKVNEPYSMGYYQREEGYRKKL